MLGAFLTLTLAVSLQEVEAGTNDNAEDKSKCTNGAEIHSLTSLHNTHGNMYFTACYDSKGNAYKPGETYTEDNTW